MKSEWEKVNKNTGRLRVPGGWIVQNAFESYNEKNIFMKIFTYKNHAIGVFVPDAGHEWNIDL